MPSPLERRGRRPLALRAARIWLGRCCSRRRQTANRLLSRTRSTKCAFPSAPSCSVWANPTPTTPLVPRRCKPRIRVWTFSAPSAACRAHTFRKATPSAATTGRRASTFAAWPTAPTRRRSATWWTPCRTVIRCTAAARSPAPMWITRMSPDCTSVRTPRTSPARPTPPWAAPCVTRPRIQGPRPACGQVTPAASTIFGACSCARTAGLCRVASPPISATPIPGCDPGSAPVPGGLSGSTSISRSSRRRPAPSPSSARLGATATRTTTTPSRWRTSTPIRAATGCWTPSKSTPRPVGDRLGAARAGTRRRGWTFAIAASDTPGSPFGSRRMFTVNRAGVGGWRRIAWPRGTVRSKARTVRRSITAGRCGAQATAPWLRPGEPASRICRACWAATRTTWWTTPWPTASIAPPPSA